MKNFPEGKFLATVKIGPKGQIVIPKEVRDMFSLGSGDQLILMALPCSRFPMRNRSGMQSIMSKTEMTDKNECT